MSTSLFTKCTPFRLYRDKSVFCLVFALFYWATPLFCQTPAIEAADKALEIAKRDSLNTPPYARALRGIWQAYHDYLIAEKVGTPDTLNVFLINQGTAYQSSMDSLVKASATVKKRDLPKFWALIQAKERVLYQDMAQSLVHMQAFTHAQMTNYAKTLPYLDLLQILYNKLGDKEGYFDNIYALEDVYSGVGQYDKAHAIVEKAIVELKQELAHYDHLSASEKAQKHNSWLRNGKRHYINLTTSLCARFRVEGNLDSAILNGKKAIALMKAYLKDSVYTPFSYNNPHFELAWVYNLNNQPDSAIVVANEGLDLYLNATLETGALLTSLGNAYSLKGDLVNIKRIALKRYESSGNKTIGQSALATFYIKTGQYTEAFKWLNQYVDSSLSIYGKGSFLGDVASNFAQSKYYLATGEYDKAEKHISRVIVVMTNLGMNTATIEIAKYDLADIYEQIGQYDKALSIRQDIHQTALTSTFQSSRERFLSWAGLGFNYMNLGQLDSAQFCYEQCYGIIKSTGINKKEDVITVLTHLGSIKESLHSYEIAEKWYQEAQIHVDSLELFDKAYISMWLSNLSQILRKRGLYAEAIEKNQKALALLRGLEKNDYNSKAQLNQALLHEVMQQNAAAADSLNGLLQHSQNRIAKEFAYLSEPDKIAYMTKLDKDLFGAMQATYARLYAKGETAKSGALFYNTVLLQKQLSLVDTRSLKQKAAILNDTLLFAQLFKLNTFDEQLKSDKPIPAAERQRLSEEMTHIRMDLELKYPKLFEKDWINVNWQSVQKQLKPDEIAIEFADVLNNDDDTTSIRNYYALVIKAGSKYPSVIPLFEEKKLVRLLDDSRFYKYDNKTGAAILSDEETVKRRYNKENGKKLYDLIWQPLENSGILRGVQTVHFAPSGLLNRVAFKALPVGGNLDKLLLQTYQLRQYNTTRALVETTPRGTPSAKDLVAFGNIQYGNCSGDSSKRASIETIPLEKADGLVARSALFLDSTTIHWQDLPNSKRELANIESSHKKYQPTATFTAFTGYNASEARFKTLGTHGKPSPSHLFISTHGFSNPTNYPESRYASAALHRAGLVMATANWTTECPLKRGNPDEEDGILTAYEIAQLNLANTELVVLSGCQTGLGDIWGREGVFGLTRGFKLAGVNHIIASLWKVPDADTADFMSTFYDLYLSGKSINVAFEQTQKAMQQKQSAYSWAAWVLIR